MHRGYFAVWRKIQDHPFYKEKRVFSKYEAWLDLLMNAQHQREPKQVCLGMTVLTQHYGETLRSIRTWGRRWSWGRSKVTRFLKLLEELNQITVKSEGKTSRITILNYKQYDPKRDRNGTRPSRDRATTEPRPNTNKNDNNVNNEKERKAAPQNPQQIINDAIAYLNQKARVEFNPDAYITQSLIIDRINEGATLDDFKAVINKKCSQWLGDDRMQGNLRPGTLFAPDKFEAYLQEARRKNNQPRPSNKPTAIELLGFGYDVLMKFGEDKFNEFCVQNNIGANDIEAIRYRVKNQNDAPDSIDLSRHPVGQ